MTQEFQSPRPTVPELTSRCPSVPEEVIRRYVERFPEHYFETFQADEVEAHLSALAALTPEDPVRVLIRQTSDGAEVTFISYDAPGEFSVLAGLLSATGFDIASGDVYTEARTAGDASESGGAADGGAGGSTRDGGRRPGAGGSTRDAGSALHPGPHPGPRPHAGAGRSRGRRPGHGARSWYRRAGSFPAPAAQPPTRYIVDRFRGTPRAPLETWSTEVTTKAREYLGLLHRGTQESYNETKRRITEEVASALDRFPVRQERALYPVEVDVEPGGTTTQMRVSGVDTPFFLYALSSALVLHDMSVERVEIHTRGEQVEDLFEFVDASGRPVSDERRLNQIRLSVAFTKQFTYFLTVAPDRYQALLRFERLIQDFLTLSERDRMDAVLSSPKILQDLARLLGASDFLWEDFIRMQHEQLLPLLASSEETVLSHSPEEVPGLLAAALEKTEGFEEKRQVLNDFKDHETYLIDLDHILRGELDFFFLSSRLTALAEAVIESAYRICFNALAARYGTPRTVAGLPANLAVMGLGKLGGEALGYASDIEMMFVYSDDGSTDGAEPIRNAEFFAHLVNEISGFIRAKREGIFQVDLRLRPYGAAGAKASSLAQFARYYSGEASSLEKLALVRMRRVAGHEEFGRRVERLRDDLVYAADSIDLAELKRLRALQLKSKGRAGQLNAKFSPGSLVDLEYSVQILQVTLGRTNPRLRTPRIHVALRELVAAGQIDAAEADRIVDAYHFLRKLINGLRMLRGNAMDLFLPAVDSLEYQHLARRMGYTGSGELGPAEQLHVEFETRTAQVRVFVERELGRDALPGAPLGTVADIILSDHVDEERVAAILSSGGFRAPERSLRNLRSLSGDRTRRYLFAELAVLAWDVFQRVPDADLALNHWEQLVGAIEDPEAHFRELARQPQRLEILLSILATSTFLSHTLFRDPGFLVWATTPHVIRGLRTEVEMRADLSEIGDGCDSHEEWLDAVRRFRRREILRIGTRDICLGVGLREITAELSNLARTIVDACLERILRESPDVSPVRFAILGFGKLGGNELNYSSDIDLLAIYEPDPQADPGAERNAYTAVMTRLNRDLTAHTLQGYLYRVDLRLRPFGSSGMLVYPLSAAVDYYHRQAAAWERQAAIKLGAVAGNRDLAGGFIAAVHESIPRRVEPQAVTDNIRTLREQKTRAVELDPNVVDVKEGRGGIRDIEFLVQGLQLLDVARAASGGGGGTEGTWLEGNTLAAIDALAARGILDEETAAHLREDYVFLRKAEHVLQIAADRQVHSLRLDAEDTEVVARRMQQAQNITEDFWPRLSQTLERAHSLYERILTRPARDDR